MNEPSFRWHDRRVLVTGCTGFLGSWVTRELLAAGAEVVGLVRDRAEPPAADGVRPVFGRVEDSFRLYSALAVHEVVAVFHLAGPAGPDRGTATVLDAVRLYNPRVPVVTARPAAEPVVVSPSLRVPLGVARFGEVFGGGDRKTFRVVPATAIGLITGDGSAPLEAAEPRDFVHAPDAARALVRLAESVAAVPRPHLQDVAFRSGWRFDDRGMADAVRAVFDGRAETLSENGPPDNPLGWRRATTLAGALSETVAWYREFLRGRSFGTRAA